MDLHRSTSRASTVTPRLPQRCWLPVRLSTSQQLMEPRRYTSHANMATPRPLQCCWLPTQLSTSQQMVDAPRSTSHAATVTPRLPQCCWLRARLSTSQTLMDSRRSIGRVAMVASPASSSSPPMAPLARFHLTMARRRRLRSSLTNIRTCSRGSSRAASGAHPSTTSPSSTQLAHAPSSATAR